MNPTDQSEDRNQEHPKEAYEKCFDEQDKWDADMRNLVRPTATRTPRLAGPETQLEILTKTFERILPLIINAKSNKSGGATGVGDQETEDYSGVAHGEEARTDKRPRQPRHDDSPLQGPKRFRRVAGSTGAALSSAGIDNVAFAIGGSGPPHFEESDASDIPLPANIPVAPSPPTTMEFTETSNVFKDLRTLKPAAATVPTHPATLKKMGRPPSDRAVREVAFMVYVPDEAHPTKGQYKDISVLGGVGEAIQGAFMAACLKNEGTRKRYARMTDPAEADSIIASNRCILNHVISNSSGGGVYKNGPFRACHQCHFNGNRACVRLFKPNGVDEAVFVVFPKQYPNTSWRDLKFWMGPQ